MCIMCHMCIYISICTHTCSSVCLYTHLCRYACMQMCSVYTHGISYLRELRHSEVSVGGHCAKLPGPCLRSGRGRAGGERPPHREVTWRCALCSFTPMWLLKTADAYHGLGSSFCLKGSYAAALCRNYGQPTKRMILVVDAETMTDQYIIPCHPERYFHPNSSLVWEMPNSPLKPYLNASFGV